MDILIIAVILVCVVLECMKSKSRLALLIRIPYYIRCTFYALLCAGSIYVTCTFCWNTGLKLISGPFTFRLFLQAAAALGWIGITYSVLTRKRNWLRQLLANRQDTTA